MFDLLKKYNFRDSEGNPIELCEDYKELKLYVKALEKECGRPRNKEMELSPNIVFEGILIDLNRVKRVTKVKDYMFAKPYFKVYFSDGNTVKFGRFNYSAALNLREDFYRKWMRIVKQNSEAFPVHN